MGYLFIVNSGSGSSSMDYESEIQSYFEQIEDKFEIHLLGTEIDPKAIKKVIDESEANTIVAVGGDGTIKLVAEQILGSDKILGIIPAGSANGMAKELGIPGKDVKAALDFIIRGEHRSIHLLYVNNELCIHLADLGFNAYLVERFDQLPQRGMWGYAKATVHALLNHERMNVSLEFEGKMIQTKAAMVVMANATKYGTGFKINPDGKLDDEEFEVVIVKDYSYSEIFKMWLTKLPVNPKKIAVYQTKSLTVHTKRKAHLQVDGEYQGKQSEVKAILAPERVNVIIGDINDDVVQ